MMGGYFLGLLKFQIFWGCLKFLVFFLFGGGGVGGMNGRCISHLFNSISFNSKTCDIHNKYNIKFVGELSSILSVNCLQFCFVRATTGEFRRQTDFREICSPLYYHGLHDLLIPPIMTSWSPPWSPVTCQRSSRPVELTPVLRT